jgi:hypothetical protein
MERNEPSVKVPFLAMFRLQVERPLSLIHFSLHKFTWYVGCTSENRIVVDALLEKSVMRTRGAMRLSLTDTYEAKSRCDCACLVAKICYATARNHNVRTVVNWNTLVFDRYVATPASLQDTSEALATVFRRPARVQPLEHAVEETAGEVGRTVRIFAQLVCDRQQTVAKRHVRISSLLLGEHCHCH